MWGLWWTKWHCNRFFIEHISFPLSISFNQWWLFFLICMLLLSGQTGEAWKPPKKQCLFRNRELGIENCQSFFTMGGPGESMWYLWWEGGTETCFCPVLRFPFQHHSIKAPYHLQVHAAVTREHMVEAWELHKEMLFWIWVKHWIETHFLFLSLKVISAYRACLRIYGPTSYV